MKGWEESKTLKCTKACFYIQAISKQKLGGGVKHFSWEATGGIWDEAMAANTLKACV